MQNLPFKGARYLKDPNCKKFPIIKVINLGCGPTKQNFNWNPVVCLMKRDLCGLNNMFKQILARIL
jgi:hypothetical protein